MTPEEAKLYYEEFVVPTFVHSLDTMNICRSCKMPIKHTGEEKWMGLLLHTCGNGHRYVDADLAFNKYSSSYSE